MQFSTISNPWAYQKKATGYVIFQGIHVIDLIFSVITIKSRPKHLELHILKSKNNKLNPHDLNF